MTINEPIAPRDQTSRSTLGLVFLTVFLDLIGFSIIFPLFPSMLVYYQQNEAAGGIFDLATTTLSDLSRFAGSPSAEWGVVVLFGGVLGSIYSLLQFACAPLWGAASDRIGRRPILLLTIFGLALSYVIWFFAAPFWMLLLARLLGGIMSGNLSTATAIVSDITPPERRGRGMAILGMAFGVGFIVGPAVGGMAAMVDLSALLPALVPAGVNPYSLAALIAFTLSAVNLLLVALFLPETRSLGAASASARTVRLRTLFSGGGNPQTARVNLVYFLFLLGFSGMEFSLTFLAADRLGFSPGQNAIMFVFVGVILAGVQGGYVRAQADRIGAKTMAMRGILFVVPGLLLIGAAAHYRSVTLLFLGLAVLGFGAAQANPCLTTLASVYAPADEQGRAMGAFRSMGALSRAMGPLAACVVYWQLGAVAAYIGAAVFLLWPAWLLRALPTPAIDTPETRPASALS